MFVHTELYVNRLTNFYWEFWQIVDRTGSILSPEASLITAVHIFEARTHEHVLINASTETVHVWGHRLSRLYYGQDDGQGLFTITRVIPPKQISQKCMLDVKK